MYTLDYNRRPGFFIARKGFRRMVWMIGFFFRFLHIQRLVCRGANRYLFRRRRLSRSAYTSTRLSTWMSLVFHILRKERDRYKTSILPLNPIQRLPELNTVSRICSYSLLLFRKINLFIMTQYICDAFTPYCASY